MTRSPSEVDALADTTDSVICIARATGFSNLLLEISKPLNFSFIIPIYSDFDGTLVSSSDSSFLSPTYHCRVIYKWKLE